MKQFARVTQLLTSLLFISSITHSVYAENLMNAEGSQVKIKQYTAQLKKSPKHAQTYVKRGDEYFLLNEFDKAVADYNQALQLDNTLDAAYFGRGLALGRAGLVDEGIRDLSEYIKRNPDSSLAYTKRGIRKLWRGDAESAEQDFIAALKINPKNAEAHDDLGVIHATRKEYAEAIRHFLTTIELDPSYQKAHHNLAMSYYLVGKDNDALIAINNALILWPESRNSMLLKSQILQALGRNKEARQLQEDAEFLPEGNWSESIPVQ